MRLKIQGGTVQHGDPPLCHTCRYATVIKGTRLKDEIVECGRLSDRARLPFAAASCSAYSDKRHATLRDMEEIAWVLRSDARQQRIGFVPARELKPKDRYVLDDWD